MNSNCNDLLSDVVRIYPLPKGDFTFGAPANIKMASVNNNFIEYSENGVLKSLTDDYLNRHLFFTISESDSVAISTENFCPAITMEEHPEVKISAKRSISGLIYSAVLTLVVKNSDPSTEDLLSGMVDRSDYDYIVCTADGQRYLLRSLDGTSEVEKSEEVKSEKEIKLKLSLQSLSSLTPII